MKLCADCNERPQQALVSYCKPCFAKRQNAYYHKNKEKNRERINAKQREKMKDPVEYQKHLARCRANYVHPEAQECEIDGCHEQGERHHDDYSKAEEIRWLCSTHHKEFHNGKN